VRGGSPEREIRRARARGVGDRTGWRWGGGCGPVAGLGRRPTQACGAVRRCAGRWDGEELVGGGIDDLGLAGG